MASRASWLASWNSVHQSTSSAATSPDSPRSTRKSYAARKRGCSSRRKGRLPARCSKRGCNDQISLIVASKRRGMAMRAACASSTLSIASNNAGNGRSPRPFAAFHVTSTSCHSSVANRNAGDTPLPSRTRASVLASAASMNLRAERLLEDHVEQRQQAMRQAVRAQALQRLDGVAREQELLHLVEQSRRWHVLHQRREPGDGLGGLRVDAMPSFAARRTARSMRTGSSRKRVTGGADELQPARADVGDAADVVDDRRRRPGRNRAR